MMMVKEINTLFRLFQFVDKNFNASKYLWHTNKMYLYAEEFTDDYALQALAKKYEATVWQTFYGLSIAEEHIDRLKKHYRKNTSGNSAIKQNGKKHLEKVTEKDIEQFASFLFTEIKNGLCLPFNYHDFDQTKKDLDDFFFILNLFDPLAGNFADQLDLQLLHKLKKLIEKKHELKEQLTAVSRLKKNSKLIRATEKLTEEEVQLNAEISTASKFFKQ